MQPTAFQPQFAKGASKNSAPRLIGWTVNPILGRASPLSDRRRLKLERKTLTFALALGVCLATVGEPGFAKGLRNPTIIDAIAFTRIQPSIAGPSSPQGPVASVSPDGRSFVAVVKRGDLRANTNLYSLLLFRTAPDLAHVSRPVTLVSRRYQGDRYELFSSAFEQVAFVNNTTVSFISHDRVGVQQVFSVALVTREVRQLTHSSGAVRSYVADQHGRLIAYSAVEPSARSRLRAERFSSDGVFPSDRSLFGGAINRFQKYRGIVDNTPDEIREYFLITKAGPSRIYSSSWATSLAALDFSDSSVANAPTKALDEEVTIHHWATLSGSPDGSAVLLFPYAIASHAIRPERWDYYRTSDQNAYSRRVSAPYGIINTATHGIQTLLDAPHPQFDGTHGGGGPVWSNDGRSVFVYTLDPLDGSPPSAAITPPHWVEVSLPSRKVRKVSMPSGWQVVAMAPAGRTLILRKGGEIAEVTRLAAGDWGRFKEIGGGASLSGNYTFATNGRIALGIQEDLNSPPEFAEVDLKSGRSRAVSRLNPKLDDIQLNQVHHLDWIGDRGGQDGGILILPAGFEPGRKYPLVILLDDGLIGLTKSPFLFDGAAQLNSNAAQVFASAGIMVLYVREPTDFGAGDTPDAPREGQRMLECVEGAVRKLDSMGIVDTHRVGLAGWSRAAYYTNYIAMHSTVAFAAASATDGGGSDYLDGFRPFTDDELRHVRTPFLFEAHGASGLAGMVDMADRLEALGRPNEFLYFAAANHDTLQPRQRLRSLDVHLEWWRFWLKDEVSGGSSNDLASRWMSMRTRYNVSAPAPNSY